MSLAPSDTPGPSGVPAARWRGIAEVAQLVHGTDGCCKQLRGAAHHPAGLPALHPLLTASESHGCGKEHVPSLSPCRHLCPQSLSMLQRCPGRCRLCVQRHHQVASDTGSPPKFAFFISFLFLPLISGHLWGQSPGTAAESLRLYLPGCSCRHRTPAPLQRRLRCTGFHHSPEAWHHGSTHGSQAWVLSLEPRGTPRENQAAVMGEIPWPVPAPGPGDIAPPASGLQRRHCAARRTRVPTAPRARALCSGHGHSRRALAPARKGRDEARTQL